MGLKLSNNGVSQLAGNIGNDDTIINLVPGSGLLFPALSAGDWFPATIIKSNNQFEIVRVTARSVDTLTVVRAQEGTGANTFSAGDRIELRLTAASVDEIMTAINARLPLEGGTIGGDLYVQRPGAPETGVVFLGNNGKFLFFNGTNYVMPAANLIVNGGTVWHSGNLNPGAYLPLAGGTISGNLQINSTAPQINFYDTDWGMRYLHCNGGMIGFLTSAGGWACYSNNDGTFIASGNIGAYSDRKHKKRIKTIKGALPMVEALRGVRYVDKRTGAARVGVIAQEVREVVPEVVGEGVDGLHVDYGNLVGVLIPAVQELAARVRALEARDGD